MRNLSLSLSLGGDSASVDKHPIRPGWFIADLVGIADRTADRSSVIGPEVAQSQTHPEENLVLEALVLAAVGKALVIILVIVVLAVIGLVAVVRKVL